MKDERGLLTTQLKQLKTVKLSEKENISED
jgi:hypothetical protein